MAKHTQAEKNVIAYGAIAKSLQEYGYPSATAAMVKETHEAMLEDAKAIRDFAPPKVTGLPHGVISLFAESQIKQLQGTGYLE